MGLFRRRREPFSETTQSNPLPTDRPEPPSMDWRSLGIEPNALEYFGTTSIGDAIWGFPATESNIATHWRACRAGWPETGLWPIVTGNPDSWMYGALAVVPDPHYDVAAALAAARRMGSREALEQLEDPLLPEDVDDGIDIDDHEPNSNPSLLSKWRSTGWSVAPSSPLDRDFNMAEKLATLMGIDSRDEFEQLGDPWEPDEFDDAMDLDDRVPVSLNPNPPVVSAWKRDGWIVLVPTPDQSEVPVRLGWLGGSSDYDVSPSIHTAVLRGWADRYGVELVVLDATQRMELIVTRPPTSTQDCYQVAHEQYRYCPDSVDQGTESIHDLAAEQAPSGVWFFWWD